MLQHFFGFVYLSAVSQLVSLTDVCMLKRKHSLYGMSLDMFLAFVFFEIKL